MEYSSEEDVPDATTKQSAYNEVLPVVQTITDLIEDRDHEGLALLKERLGEIHLEFLTRRTNAKGGIPEGAIVSLPHTETKRKGKRLRAGGEGRS